MRNKISKTGPDAAGTLGPCPICGRPMMADSGVDRHHGVPRSKDGREWAWVHQICHRMIHRLFSDSDLAGPYAEAEAIRAHPEMQKFIAWVRRKPVDYVDWPKAPRDGRPDRRR